MGIKTVSLSPQFVGPVNPPSVSFEGSQAILRPEGPHYFNPWLHALKLRELVACLIRVNTANRVTRLVRKWNQWNLRA